MSLLRLKKISTSDAQWEVLLRSIVKRAIAVEPNCRIFLFGSFVEDRFTAESDIDLAVIVPDNVSAKSFLTEIYRPGRLSTWPLDLIVVNETHFAQKSNIGGVCFDIRESGIELYPNWSLNGTTVKEI